MSLYPNDPRAALTLPKEDYDILVQFARGAKSALEFGPGYSTYALIEAGVPTIISLEHTDEWFNIAKEKFKDFPQVTIARYWDEMPVRVDEIANRQFDVALVDSPKGFNNPIPGVNGVRKIHPGYEDCSRFNTCVFAVKHAPEVLLHDAARPLERGSLGRLWLMGHHFEMVPPRFARIVRDANKNRLGSQGAKEPGRIAAGPSSFGRGI